MAELFCSYCKVVRKITTAVRNFNFSHHSHNAERSHKSESKSDTAHVLINDIFPVLYDEQPFSNPTESAAIMSSADGSSV
jgi:hypothetical protein